jgi:hypothetical protein
MRTRSLKIRLKQLIDKRYPGKKPALEKIGEYLDLNPQIVRRYLRNEQLKLERRVLERACDWLDVDIGELLELVPCDFFPHGDTLHSLCTKNVSPDDHEALGEVYKLFGSSRIEDVVSANSAELARHVYERDCVIVGSPHHNGAGEVALCTLFSADFGSTLEENRGKLPLVIEAPDDWQQPNALVKTTENEGIPLRCHVMVPESGEKFGDLKTFGKKSAYATADFFPLKDFQQASFEKAKDFGIILVADHWVSGDRKVPVRTYWLSGFSSIGTLASYRVLEDGVRNFSLDTPQDRPGEFILAVIQATFRKEAGSHNRTLNDDYEIVHTIRGSLPHPVRVPIDQSTVRTRSERPDDQLSLYPQPRHGVSARSVPPPGRVPSSPRVRPSQRITPRKSK